jgi:hypothetical protein
MVDFTLRVQILDRSTSSFAAVTRAAHRVDDLYRGEIPFVIGHHDAAIRYGDRGDDHGERAAWLAARRVTDENHTGSIS